MANADQLKALIKSYSEGDEHRFYSVAMQIAAHKARKGHGRLAQELRALIDEAKVHTDRRAVPITRPRGELANLLAVSYPKVRIGEMILSGTLAGQIQRVILEQRYAHRILKHGLSPRRRLLLIGPPGTGKTLTASVLAGELGIPLFQIRLDGLITKYMGETAAKLRHIFVATSHTRGVYFFDEFDAIGSQRGLTNDVGEIRRVLNSFLLMIEQDRSHSLIVAATNHAEILDRALFRRFDDVLYYDLPGQPQIKKLLETRLSPFTDKNVRWGLLAEGAVALNYAEVSRAADEVLKSAIIEGRKVVKEKEIRSMLDERLDVARKLVGDI